MSSLLTTVDPSDLSLSWRTPYVSEGINRKGINDTRGIVRGFNLNPNYWDSGKLVLAPDSLTNDSVINGVTVDGKYSITYRTTSVIPLSFPIIGKYWIAFKPNYTTSGITSGEIVAYTEADIEASLHVTEKAVVIGALDYQSVGIIYPSWIMYFGTTTNGTAWQRTLQERYRGDHGRQDLSIIYNDDFRFPEKWSISGRAVAKTDFNEYDSGCCSLRVQSFLFYLDFSAKKKAYKTVMHGDIHVMPMRFIVELRYKTSSNFTVGTSDTGVDLVFKTYDKTTGSFGVMYANNLSSSECPSFKYITVPSTSYTTLRYEVIEPFTDSNISIIGIKPVIEVHPSVGTIWFDDLKIYQTTPMRLYRGDPDVSYNADELYCNTLNFLQEEPLLTPSVRDGFSIRVDRDGGVLDELQILPPTLGESQVILGQNFRDSKYEFRGHLARPTGRKSVLLKKLDLEFDDGRILLPTEDHFGAMISDAPPVVPGGLIASYRGNCAGNIDSAFNMYLAVNPLGNSIRCEMVSDDIDGNLIKAKNYVVVFALGNWSSGYSSAYRPISGFVENHDGWFEITLYSRDGTVLDPFDGIGSHDLLQINIMAFRSENIPTWA